MTAGYPRCAHCDNRVPRSKVSRRDLEAEAAYLREHPSEKPAPRFCTLACFSTYRDQMTYAAGRISRAFSAGRAKSAKVRARQETLTVVVGAGM